MLDTSVTLQCPFCWQTFQTRVELLDGTQEYVEDCQICCHPLEIRLQVESGTIVELTVERES